MTDISTQPSRSPVLILGGGIHGAAIARELILNGVPVVLADANDLATGATSKSSRLIHGGLRYLEYGDVGLVRESLIERGRLLQLAPHLVQPLRLFVPTSKRWSGLLRSVLGFFKLARTRIGRWLLSRSERKAPRGYWPVRMGLWMYDVFSWSDGLPKSRGSNVVATEPVNGSPPAVDPTRYRWMAEYSDAQMLYPERCVFALLAEAAQLAREQGVTFDVVPYAKIELQGSAIGIQHSSLAKPAACFPNQGLTSSACWLTPSLIINVSGAWGDMTLRGIDAGTIPMFAGTKGSHFITRHPALMRALRMNGVYAETTDRRLCFILPFDDAVLVGTTDERWSGPPDSAVASDEELDYLLGLVRTVFGLALTRDDIESHYSGVRPLPKTTDASNAAVTRDHHLAQHRLHNIPIITLVGGKLTTFRSVAEQIANQIFRQLGLKRKATTRDRLLLGAEGFPNESDQRDRLIATWATDFDSTPQEVSALWKLYGTRAKTVLSEVQSKPRQLVADTPFTTRVVRWVIEHEWASTLDDLIERRLMLIFAPSLTMNTLQDLGKCLVDAERLRNEDLPATVATTRERLRIHYGRRVD